MTILAVYGSPRKGGNTDRMLDAFLDGAMECGAPIERVYARDLHVAGCLGCGYCDRAGACIQKDDMTLLYESIENAERIVVASPIYFYNVTAQLKLIIDRSQAVFMKRKNTGDTAPARQKKGFFLGAGATRGKRLFEGAELTMKYFFDACGVEYAGGLFYREFEERDAVIKHASALEECRRAGREFAAGA